MAKDRIWSHAKLASDSDMAILETTNQVVDTEENVLGFSVLKVSGIGAKPIEVAL